MFDQAVTWATKPGKANFWRSAQEQRTFVFGAVEEYTLLLLARDKQAKALQLYPLSDEYAFIFPALMFLKLLTQCGLEGMKAGLTSYVRRE